MNDFLHQFQLFNQNGSTLIAFTKKKNMSGILFSIHNPVHLRVQQDKYPAWYNFRSAMRKLLYMCVCISYHVIMYIMQPFVFKR